MATLGFIALLLAFLVIVIVVAAFNVITAVVIVLCGIIMAITPTIHHWLVYLEMLVRGWIC